MKSNKKVAIIGLTGLVAGCFPGHMVISDNDGLPLYFAPSVHSPTKDRLLYRHGYILEKEAQTAINNLEAELKKETSEKTLAVQKADETCKELVAQKEIGAEKTRQLEEYIQNADNVRAIALQHVEIARTANLNFAFGVLTGVSALIAVVGLGYAIKKYVFHR